MRTLEQLNAASAAEFASLLEGIYEHSPWIAERAAAHCHDEKESDNNGCHQEQRIVTAHATRWCQHAT